jgi:hypothetical protein
MPSASRFVVTFATLAAIVALAAAAPRARAADPVPATAPAAQATPPQAAPAESHVVTPESHALLAPSTALEGIWMFDPAHSDDPAKIMQANRPQRGEGGGPPMGGGPRGGEGGGGWGGRGGERGMRGGGDDAGGDHPDQPAENRPRGPSPFSRVMRPAKKVVIEMQADQVNVTEDEGAVRAYAIADSLKAHDRELLTENTSARWKNGRLEMIQTLGQRGKLVETYELSHDGNTLTIRAQREGGPSGMPNPVITRVYTRYDGE